MAGFGRTASRRAGAVGVALTLWDVWRRLPQHQRVWVTEQARTHGPRVARQVLASQRERRGRSS